MQRLYLCCLFVLLGTVLYAQTPIISEIHVGSSTALRDHNFVEIYNPTPKTIDLSGWTLVCQSNLGSFFVQNTCVSLSGNITPGQALTVGAEAGQYSNYYGYTHDFQTSEFNISTQFTTPYNMNGQFRDGAQLIDPCGNVVDFIVNSTSSSSATPPSWSLIRNNSGFYALRPYQNSSGAFSNFSDQVVETPGSHGAGTLNYTQATNFSFSLNSTTSANISWNPASSGGSTLAPTGYLVFRRANATPTFVPSDQTDYTVGSTYGNSTCVYKGSGTSFTDAGINFCSDQYYYRIYVYYTYNTVPKPLASRSYPGDGSTNYPGWNNVYFSGSCYPGGWPTSTTSCPVYNTTAPLTGNSPVLSEPTINSTIPSTTASVCEGANTSFSVNASSGSGPNYQWFDATTGTPLAGETNDFLSLSSVSVADDGDTYYVEVTDAGSGCSVQSPDLTLNVDAVPVITTDLQDTTICAVGDDASFTVATNPGTWEYAFYNITDFTFLPGGGSPVYTPDNFRIFPTTAGDNGDQWLVIVRNPANAACLTVSPAPYAQVNIVGAAGTNGVWTGLDNGDWNNCLNWDDGLIPDPTTNVLIDDANTLNPLDIGTMPSTTTVNDFTLNTANPANTPINPTNTPKQLIVNGTLDLENGHFQISAPPFTNPSPIGNGYVFVSSGNANDVQYNNGFIYGTLIQNSSDSTGLYNFPIGNPTEGLNLAQLDFLTPSDQLFIFATFRDDLTPVIPPAIANATECGQDGYTDVLGNYIWRLDASNPAGSTPFNVILHPSASFPGDYTPISGNRAATIMKSDFSATPGGHNWSLSGSCAPGLGTSNLNGANPIVTRTGLTSFSDFTVILDADDPFPVEWLNFTAERRSATEVALQWTTAVEENNQGFFLERSFDGQNFQEIDFVAGAGNTTQPVHYNRPDNQATPDRLYYRLRQMDFDGRVNFSNVVEVAPLNGTPAGDFSLTLYPNPFANTLQLRSDLPGDTPASLHLYSVEGKRLFSAEDDFAAAAAALQQHSQDLASGVYLLHVQALGHTKHLKLIKQ